MYLQNNLHAIGDKGEPPAVLLDGGGVSGGGRIDGDGGIGERVEEALRAAYDCAEIGRRVEGGDRGKVVEAEVDSGGEEPGGASGERAEEAMAGEGRVGRGGDEGRG